MRSRTSAILAATVAVVATLLVASPAEARSHDSYLRSPRVAISASGTGQVAVQCKARTTCRGKLSFTADTGSPRVRSYRVAAGRTAYVPVALHAGSSANPYHAPAVAGRDYRAVSRVRLKIDQDAPRNRTYTDTLTTETLVSRQRITGHVTGLGAQLASDVRVDLVATVRGGNTKVVKGQDVPANGGAFSLSVNLGPNNSASTAYRLKVTGTDQDGVRRSWYWRGADRRPSGGGAHLRDASTLRATKTRAFTADITYSSISGTTAPGAEVTVASPPPSWGDADDRRELDILACANQFGATRADGAGTYTVGFLPVTGSTNNRYMVATRAGGRQVWYGQSGQRFGSCYDATGYRRTRAALITLRGPLTGKTLDASASGNSVTVRSRWSSAYKPTSEGDRWVTIREKVPGVRILDAPVVAQGMASSKGVRTFANLEPGTYWVETGRRMGCADWYPSRYTNNRTYFKGLDRLSEQWKSFTTLSKLRGSRTSGYERIARTVQPNPATDAAQGHRLRGYAGWMYRSYCKALGAGTINTLKVSGTGVRKTVTTSRNPQGAVVKGRVTRAKGRTTKELMVTLTSSRGTRVVRSDLTDGSGTFYVAGLTSGNWKITVNSDSWRGIGRAFSGRKTIRVKAGTGYNVGTLTFKD